MCERGMQIVCIQLQLQLRFQTIHIDFSELSCRGELNDLISPYCLGYFEFEMISKEIPFSIQCQVESVYKNSELFLICTQIA